MDEKPRKDRKNDVEIGPLASDGDKLIASIRAGNMVAVLSGMEVMYTFLYRGRYQCFIHPLDAQEGRHKDWAVNERNTAMLKNLTAVADQLFEIKFGAQMDFMGVMVAAERGIIGFLDSIGRLPAEDYDFMAPLEDSKDSQNANEDSSI